MNTATPDSVGAAGAPPVLGVESRESPCAVCDPLCCPAEWGYLHEALEGDGANRMELLFTPAIDLDLHALFLQQNGQSDPTAPHVVIEDQAGLHLLAPAQASLRAGDPRLPANPDGVGAAALRPVLLASRTWKNFCDLVKDALCNRLFKKLRVLEDAILAELEPLRQSATRVATSSSAMAGC